MSLSLPSDWELVPIGTYMENHDSARIPVSKKERAKKKGEFPYYGASGVIDQIDNFTHEGEFLLLAEDGANLLARSKPIAFLAKGQFWVNNHAHVLKCKGDAPNAYVAYYLNSIDLSPYVTGSAQPKLNQANMNKIPIPVAPLDQQVRIVAEIEKQFSRLDEAVASLKRVKANLKRYKAAVLKAAVEGKLTEEWRKQNPDVEPASKLLERILAERRTKWEEAELAKMKAKGKVPKNDKWKEKYKEPEGLSKAGQYELPESWLWVTFGQLALDSQNGLSKRRSEKGQPTAVLRLADIEKGKISAEAPREIKLSAIEREKYLLDQGDWVCIRVNGSPDLVGRMISVDTDDEWAFCDHFIRFRADQSLLARDYISRYFDGELARDYVDKHKVSSAGQNAVSQTTMAAVPLPLAPFEEQLKILDVLVEVEEYVSRISNAVDLNILRANRLRQSALAAAFSGASGATK